MEKADVQVIEFPRRLRLVFLRFSSLFIRGMSKKMEGPKILAWRVIVMVAGLEILNR